MHETESTGWTVWLARIALTAAAITAALVAFAPIGFRLRLLPLGAIFLGILKYAVFLGAAALVLLIVRQVFVWTTGKKGGGRTALAALILMIAILAVPVINLAETVRSGLPSIHDITTDIDNPPAFVAALALRGPNANSTHYDAAQTGALQKKAYPDIVPLSFDKPPADVFSQALATAKAQGWTIVASVPEEGRIEASDTTLFFGFTDDIVIRIQPSGAGSRLDIRSESRVGVSDLGKNAARIRGFLKALKGA